MTKYTSRNLTIEDLFDLLMQSTRELIELTNSEHTEEYEAKTKEVKLLQKAIVEKRAQFHPGPSLL
jgi:hypothetical protein